MFTERHRTNGTIDYPLGGGQSIIKALVRGLRKHGGKLLLCSHVDNIIVEDGRAVGLTFYKTRGPMKGTKMTMRSRKAVISNASIWDTAKLIPGNSDFVNQAKLTPKTESFMHLHLGIDATGLPKDLECHHLIVNNWEDISAPQNVCIISIPTVFDPSLAPSGHHTVHAYTAGNEPYQIWKGMDRKSTQYTALKEERSQVRVLLFSVRKLGVYIPVHI
jgi:phytoene dehydrogenase-like protein